MKRLFLIMFFLAISVQSDAAKMSSYTENTTPNEDVYFIGVDPNDTTQTANGSNYRYPLSSILGSGLLDFNVNSLTVSGTGDSWFELKNNTSFTDTLTGKYGLRFYNGALQKIINGTATDIATAAPTIQAADPTIGSSTGWYLAQTSGDLFYVNYGIEMFTIAGARTADETAPVIVAGADSTHDGSTPVTATMELTELYPDPSTLLYTVTGGTPASGTWAGTYPNYSLEVTPTGTSGIVVTSSATDLAGNTATGTDLEQTFTYSGGVACSGDFSSGSNESFESSEDAFCTTDGTVADTTGVISTYDTNFYNTGTHGMSIVCDSDNSAANNRIYFDYGSTLSSAYLRAYIKMPTIANYNGINTLAIGNDNNESVSGVLYLNYAQVDGSYRLKIRNAGVNTAEYFVITPGQKYRIEILAADFGACALRVYNEAGTQLETSNGGGDTECNMTGAETDIRYFVFRDSSSSSTATTAYFDDIKISTSDWIGAE